MLRLATKLAAKTLSENEILLKLNRQFILWEAAFLEDRRDFPGKTKRVNTCLKKL